MAFKMKGPTFFKDALKDIMSSDYMKSKSGEKSEIDVDELKKEVEESEKESAKKTSDYLLEKGFSTTKNK